MGRKSKVAGRRLIRVAFRVGLRDAIRSLRQRDPLHRLLEGPVVAEPDGYHREKYHHLKHSKMFYLLNGMNPSLSSLLLSEQVYSV